VSGPIHPWMVPLWRRLAPQRQSPPQALLFAGPKGTGKLDFAVALAAALVCDAPDVEGFACGRCRPCIWRLAGTHPDLLRVEPAEAAEAEGAGEKTKEKAATTHIAVDQIRELSSEVALTSHRERYRVVLVQPAEALNVQAANALLKTLEEPPPKTVFLLVSHQPRRLLPTVVSRCQIVTCARPERGAARAWLAERGVPDPDLALALAGDAPIEALRRASDDQLGRRKQVLSLLEQAERADPVALSDRCHDWSLPDLLDWLQGWCADLLHVRLADTVRCHIDRAQALGQLARRCDVAALLDWERSLAQARRSVSHPLNSRLVLETLMLQYRKVFER